MPIIAVAGAAGTGKTTLGRALAAGLGLPLLDLDTLTEPLLDGLAPWLPPGDHWNAARHRATVRPARYAALRALLADQASVGSGAVVVAPFTAELAGGPEWRALIDACGAEPVVVRMVGDPELLVERRGERAGGAAAARDAHARPAPEQVPAIPHLEISSALSTEQQLVRVRRHLGGDRPLPERSPVYERDFLAALFDLDGTLIDSTPAVLRSWSRLATEFDINLALLEASHGRPAELLLTDMLPLDQVPRALARIEHLESTEVSGVRAIPGSLELFDAMPSRAIVTSGTVPIASSRIAASGLVPPEVVVTFDDVERGKPDPEPFLTGAGRLGVDAAGCVAFEDAPAGITAARAAGCTVVAITGTHSADELAAADLIVDRLDQLEVVPLADGGFRLAPRT
ncbi:HAD-IA family hydrolase [Leucobacter sp. CSA1]|uniref:HAD-IA family hydrolase n=1 Tax=Leucobacter chromiisoli TaxID=2796471 RepID=A0A934Q2V5_9MICO|nr:HAD-IA family hydrolase [Leucobacter chromiisoli]MBK0417525.1 HAD-IA family hydrolase [Leucobacter chromiisoli]